MKNQNIWIKRSVIYFYFLFSSIGFASDNTNDRAVKRYREYSETEQPVRKNMRKLTEDEQEKAEIKLCKVQSCIRNLKISWKEEDRVFMVDLLDLDIYNFFKNHFFDVLEKLRKSEKICLFQYLLQDLNPTMKIKMKEFNYSILERGEWIKSSFCGSNIYFFKEILDKEDMLESLYSLVDVEKQNPVPAYFIFPYDQDNDLNDIKDRLKKVGADYKKEVDTIRQDIVEKDHKTCLDTITNILNMRNILDKDYKTYMKYPDDKLVSDIPNMLKIRNMVYITYKRYIENELAKIKNKVSQAYWDYIDEIVKIYNNEMMYPGHMIDMKLSLNETNRSYETCIKRAVDMGVLDVAGDPDVTKILNILTEIRKVNQIYINGMRSEVDTIYRTNEKNVEKSSDFGILSVALVENSWKYQKIALIPNDIYDFDLAYTMMEEPLKALSLKFDDTARKSKNSMQPGGSNRDDYLLDLMNVLNCDLYSCSRTPDVARIEISPDHSFPYALAERLEEIRIEEDYEEF